MEEETEPAGRQGASHGPNPGVRQPRDTEDLHKDWKMDEKGTFIWWICPNLSILENWTVNEYLEVIGKVWSLTRLRSGVGKSLRLEK